MVNIIEKLIEIEKHCSDKLSIIENNIDKENNITSKHFTYSKLLKDINTTAYMLKKRGVKKGDRIILFIPMCYNTYRVMLSNIYIGAVTVFIDAWADKKRIIDAVNTVKPKFIITVCKEPFLNEVFDSINIIDFNDLLESNLTNDSLNINLTPESLNDDDEIMITFTTGSTGIPKAARRTYGYCLNQLNVISKYFNYNSSEINLVTLPIFLLGNLFNGVTSVIPAFDPALPSNIYGKNIIHEIKMCNVNSSISSTIFCEKLSDYLIKNNETLDIDKIIIGGSPIFKPTAAKLRKAFPKTNIMVLYGATEVVPISYVSIDEVLNAKNDIGLFIGKPIEELDVRIIKKVDGNISLDNNSSLDDFTLPNYAVGEIIVSGPHVLKSYLYNNEENFAMRIMDKDKFWHRTGDGGSIDKDGNLYLYGRVSNSFIYKDNLLFPLPLEAKIQNIAGVKFAAVMSINSEVYVFIETDCNQQELEAINEQIFNIISTDKIIFMDKIPRDPRHNSKVNYEDLKKLYI